MRFFTGSGLSLVMKAVEFDFKTLTYNWFSPNRV